jgi:hypothetical protein
LGEYFVNKALIGRVILSLVAVFTAVMPYLADWNATHIFNPRWTPHAKFHNAQTMAFAAVLGVLALVYIWRHSKTGDDRSNIVVGGIFAGLYWITQGLAHFYPDVAYMDPEFVTKAAMHPILGLTPQGIIDVVVLLITASGVALAVTSSKHLPSKGYTL